MIVSWGLNTVTDANQTFRKLLLAQLVVTVPVAIFAVFGSWMELLWLGIGVGIGFVLGIYFMLKLDVSKLPKNEPLIGMNQSRGWKREI